MKIYLKYLSYVIRHKWFVFIECLKVGMPIRGLLHDIDKFYPDEFIPYAKHFFGDDKPKRDKTGYYRPYATGNDKFDKAWFLHTKRNKHHWQYWILAKDGDDEDGVILFPMPKKYIKEMICDWKGAGKAQHSKLSTQEWYLKNKHKLRLHPETQKIIEKILAIK